MSTRKHKILLLGVDGFNASNETATLVSCSWEKLEAAPNLRDFDSVVVACFADDPEEIDWSYLPEILNPEVVRNVLFHGGQFIVLGNPIFNISGPGGYSHRTNTLPFLTWTGISFDWQVGCGDTVHYESDRDTLKYEAYLRLLKKWSYSLTDCNLTASNRYKETNRYEELKVRKLALNRYRQALAFEATLTLQQICHDRGNRFDRSVASGSLIFLPAVAASPDETIRLALRDLCGFSAAVVEPDWAQQLIAPGQAPLDKRTEEVQAEILGLENQLADIKRQRIEKRKFLSLLYERELILEPLVWGVLRFLGGQVEEPVERNKEDGWLTVTVGAETFEAVLEIKSTKNDHFAEDGRKQLLDWINRGTEIRSKLYKGIFIGNSAVSKPPGERPCPFADNWETSARLNKICALTTSDLYQAFEAHSAGNLDLDAFWKSIFQCSGIFSFKEFLDKSST